MSADEQKNTQATENQPAETPVDTAPAAGGERAEKDGGGKAVKIVGIIAIIVVILLAIYFTLYQIGLIPYYRSYDGNIFEATAAFYQQAKEDFELNGVPGMEKVEIPQPQPGPTILPSTSTPGSSSVIEELPTQHKHYDELVKLLDEINAGREQVEAYNSDLSKAYTDYLAARKVLEDQFSSLSGQFDAEAAKLDDANRRVQANAGDQAAKDDQKAALAAAEGIRQSMEGVKGSMTTLDNNYVATRDRLVGERTALMSKIDDLRAEFQKLEADR